MDADNIARLVYLLLILLAVGGWLLVSIKEDLNKTIQMALVWVLIFLGFFGVYGLWEDISKNFQKDPNFEKVAENVYLIKKSLNGHFYTSARINDEIIKFLIDTGATRTILSFEDAQAAKIDVVELDFVNPIQTANGVSYSASHQVENFVWFGNEFQGVTLNVTNGDLFNSLLGMDIISKAKTFLISGDTLQLSFN